MMKGLSGSLHGLSSSRTDGVRTWGFGKSLESFHFGTRFDSVWGHWKPSSFYGI